MLTNLAMRSRSLVPGMDQVQKHALIEGAKVLLERKVISGADLIEKS